MESKNTFKQSDKEQDDEEMEPFQMGSDYEEGHFDEETGEFYFKREKEGLKRMKMTKDDHIYGDFIDQNKRYWEKRDFSNKDIIPGSNSGGYGDEDDGKNYVESKGFMGGVAFIKSKQQVNKQTQQAQKSKETHSTILPQQKENKKSVTFNDKVQIKEIDNNQTSKYSQQMQFSSGGIQVPEEEKSFIPVTFGKSGSNFEQQNKRKQKEERKNDGEKQKLETQLTGKYGKGLALLQKMGGFKLGQGVGKSNQGITNPIEAVVSKGKQCLGNEPFVVQKKEEKPQKSEDGTKVKQESQKQKLDKEDSDFLKLLYQSKKQGGKVPTKPVSGKEKFQQVNDQFFSVNTQKSQGLQIIDMRGGQHEEQVLSDLTQLKQRAENIYQVQSKQVKITQQHQKFKLCDKINLYKEQVKHDLQSIINKKNYHESKLLQLRYEQENIIKQVHDEEERKVMLSDFKNEVKRIIDSVEDDIHKDDEIYRKCLELCERFREFYSKFDVNTMIVKQIVKIIRTSMQSWDILKNPMQAFTDFCQVRSILTVGKGNSNSESQYDDFNKIPSNDYINDDIIYWIFNETWLPPIRKFINSEWDVKPDSKRFLEFLVQWSHLFPERFQDKLIDNYIKPKLEREINYNWNPKDTKDQTNLIQNWFLPWEEFLGPKEMQVFFVKIKILITSSLSDWKPDQSLAKDLLLPWKGFLDPKSFENTVQRIVVPKLAFQIKKLEIVPDDQDIKPIYNLLEWQGIIDSQTLALILRENLFTKWINTLQQWLDMSDEESVTPDEKNEIFEQIEQWYQGWKGLIPAEIRNQEKIQEVFTLAMQLLSSKLE